MEFSYYTGLASEMIMNDSKRNELFSKMDDMYHVKWELPPALKSYKWIRTVKNSDPRDAVQTAIQIFSGLDPRIKIVPLADDDANKDQAETWERYLGLCLKDASLRRRTSVIRDLMRSAILYDMVAAQVTYLPWQEKIAKRPGEEKRWKNARDEYGDWIVTVRHPKDVHVNYSDIVPEQILYVSKWKVADVINFYGKAAKEITSRVNENNPSTMNDDLYIYEYCDIDRKVVWASEDGYGGGATYKIVDEDHGLPFMPWACRVGGTTLDTDPQYQVSPLLAPIYHSGDWETVNIAQSLLISDMIARAAAPRHIFQGPGGEMVEFDYMTPGGRVDLPQGVDYKSIPVEPVDPNIPTALNLLTQAMSKSTLPRMMTEGNTPVNVNFATYNMSIQTGVAKIRQYRELAEQVSADICKLFFKWIRHNGSAVFYNERAEDTFGKQMLIDPKSLPERLNLTVELSPDVATDRQQKINAAVMAMQLGFPKEYALEEIGVTDPSRAMRISDKEKVREAMLQTELALMQQKGQMALQTQQQQMALQTQQQQLNQMANNAPMQQNPANGIGFDPNQGGIPAQMMNPEMTREMQTGMTQGGQDVGF